MYSEISAFSQGQQSPSFENRPKNVGHLNTRVRVRTLPLQRYTDFFFPDFYARVSGLGADRTPAKDSGPCQPPQPRQRCLQYGDLGCTIWEFNTACILEDTLIHRDGGLLYSFTSSGVQKRKAWTPEYGIRENILRTVWNPLSIAMGKRCHTVRSTISFSEYIPLSGVCKEDYMFFFYVRSKLQLRPQQLAAQRKLLF